MKRLVVLSLAVIVGFLAAAPWGKWHPAARAQTAAAAVATAPTPPISATAPVRPYLSRVMVISADGLRPDLLLRANTPHMHAMFQRGSYSFWARTTAMSVTLPSHTSMLTGVPPHRHGITWNSDIPLKEPIYPAYPTLFELAKHVGYTTAMAAGKVKFKTLDKPGTLDWIFVTEDTGTDDEVASAATALIRQHQPQVMFIHFPSIDTAGHAFGWGSPQQVAVIENMDACLGRVLDTLAEARLLDSTLVILTADHGGAGKEHGPDDPRSRHIPWIAMGPGVKQGYDLTRDESLVINTEDTFATACFMLGIPLDRLHKKVDGRPVLPMLEQDR